MKWSSDPDFQKTVAGKVLPSFSEYWRDCRWNSGESYSPTITSILTRVGFTSGFVIGLNKVLKAPASSLC